MRGYFPNDRKYSLRPVTEFPLIYGTWCSPFGLSVAILIGVHLHAPLYRPAIVARSFPLAFQLAPKSALSSPLSRFLVVFYQRDIFEKKLNLDLSP